ncbi:MAG TPA: 2-isopropylmalate synthase [Clostridia bacterium]|jgi:2-isopropylmalate synthase|nr:2-isopropylmalate synthase [Clostridia bacterium]
MRKIQIFDTTLRDGEQAPSCSMHITEKIDVALALEALGVDIIEAGFAASSQGDFESVKAIAERVKNCSVASLARCVKRDIDLAYEAVKNGASPRIHVFLATSPIHMQYKLKMSEEKVLKTIDEHVRYTRKLVDNVEFSCEDATRSERPFLVKAVETAIQAGATVINIPDTVGYTTPSEMYDLIKYLKANVKNADKAKFSVHCHNDLGLAVANSLAAVEAGADQVECSINGLGERAGNAALEEVIMGLVTRQDKYQCELNVNTQKIYSTSNLVYKTLGLRAPINKPIVGENAFAHEAGIHQHGVLANRATYEIMSPQSVGIPSNSMVFGKHSGKHAIRDRLKTLGYTLTDDEMNVFFEKFKALADKRRKVSDAELIALVGVEDKYEEQEYKLDRFTVNSGNKSSSSAVVRLLFNNQLIEKVALGHGPVDAAFNAVDKIIKGTGRELDDYSIQSVTDGNDALGEATVKIKYNDTIYTGTGLSTDIIEASIIAYIKAINKTL